MAVTVTISCFERFIEPGRSLRLFWRSCQFLDFLHSIGLRCVDGYMINVLFKENRSNHYVMRVWLNLPSRITLIDTPLAIAETPILSLRCVDALRSMGLRAVVARFARPIYTVVGGCVDLTLETLTPSGLSDELPTDWVKSD